MDESVYQPFEGWEITEELGEGLYRMSRADEEGAEEQCELKIVKLENTGEESKAAAKKIATVLAMEQKLKDCAHTVSYLELKAEKLEDGKGGVFYIRREGLTPLAEYCRENGVDETLVLRLGIDICKAITEADALGVNHGNIRPRNIYVTEDGFFKLGGFGESTAREIVDSGVAACEYMAPEVFHGQRWDTRADVYSLGMVLYWLLNRCRGAFLPQPPEKLTQEIVEQALKRRMGGEHIAPARFGGRVLQNAVLRAVEFNPRERYTSAEQLMNALERLPQRRSDPYAVPVQDEEPMPMPENETENDGQNQGEETQEIERFEDEIEQSEDEIETDSAGENSDDALEAMLDSITVEKDFDKAPDYDLTDPFAASEADEDEEESEPAPPRRASRPQRNEPSRQRPAREESAPRKRKPIRGISGSEDDEGYEVQSHVKSRTHRATEERIDKREAPAPRNTRPVRRAVTVAPEEESEEEEIPAPTTERETRSNDAYDQVIRRNLRADESYHPEDYYDNAYRDTDDEPYEEYDELDEDYPDYYEEEEEKPKRKKRAEADEETKKPGKLIIIGLIAAGIIFVASLAFLISRFFG